jgi:hypothetical protein
MLPQILRGGYCLRAGLATLIPSATPAKATLRPDPRLRQTRHPLAHPPRDRRTHYSGDQEHADGPSTSVGRDRGGSCALEAEAAAALQGKSLRFGSRTTRRQLTTTSSGISGRAHSLAHAAPPPGEWLRSPPLSRVGSG